MASVDVCAVEQSSAAVHQAFVLEQKISTLQEFVYHLAGLHIGTRVNSVFRKGLVDSLTRRRTICPLSNSL